MFATISSWILSIAGVVCLSVLVQLILPEGQMSRYIKIIFSFITLFVIISPIPKLVNSNIDIDGVFKGELSVQENYLEQLNLDKVIKEDIEKDFADQGFENAIVSINADIFASKFEIKSVSVDIGQIVLSGKDKHIDKVTIKNRLVEIIQANIKIEKGDIYFYE